MKRFLMGLIAIILLTGCSAEKYIDNQVYIADSGSENRDDRFVDWIDVQGEDQFLNEDDISVSLLEGELLLTIAPDGLTYYVMQPVAEVGLVTVLDTSHVQVAITKVDVATGNRQLIAQRVPFVIKAKWNHTGEIVAFCGSGHLNLYDSKKDKLILQGELDSTAITDFFWSPIDHNKMYIDQPDTAGGGLYYVEPQKKIELYETKEKIYYKAHLEKEYYYATQWRSNENDTDGALYTVLANEERNVIKIIGRGSYKDSYLNRVLLMNEDQFGLFYVADINQVSKGFELTNQFVYDAKFLSHGRIAYITRLEEWGKNEFCLNICDAEGKLLYTQTVSGNGFLLSADGSLGYINGVQQEIIDFENLKMIQQVSAPRESIDAQLLLTLRGAAAMYIHLNFRQPIAEKDISEIFLDNPGSLGMAYSEMLSRNNLQETMDTPLYYRAVLDQSASIINNAQDMATCRLELMGLNNEGQSFTEPVSWDLVKKHNKWYVVGLSTFCQETQREKIMENMVAFLEMHRDELPIDIEAITWRQIQYWQKNKEGLVATPSQAKMIKADAEPGGMVIWFQYQYDGTQLSDGQIWYHGNWIYPNQE